MYYLKFPHTYGGDQKDGETFQVWLEAVSELTDWDECYKLVYLTTALRGMAKSFYRSCSPMQRSKYDSLVNELERQFTPVQLIAIQMKQFQDPRETVDEFAQDLRRLYSQAYASFTKGTPEAEKGGQTVLASQCVTGLHPSVQGNVAGMEGGMDQLVLRARFEEAKSIELVAAKPATEVKIPSKGNPPDGGSVPAPGTSKVGGAKTNTQEWASPRNDGNARKCFICGLGGHLSRTCSYPKSTRRQLEARGRTEGTVTTMQRGEKPARRTELKISVGNIRKQRWPMQWRRPLVGLALCLLQKVVGDLVWAQQCLWMWR